MGRREMEVLVFQQLIKAVEPLQSHEMPISLSSCTFSIIPDANCCQLQRCLLSSCCQTGFLCLCGVAAPCSAEECEQAGGAALAVPSSLSRWDVLSVGFLLRRAWLGVSSGKVV